MTGKRHTPAANYSTVSLSHGRKSSFPMRDEVLFLTSKNMLENERLLSLRTWSIEDENRMSSEPLEPTPYVYRHHKLLEPT